MIGIANLIFILAVFIIFSGCVEEKNATRSNESVYQGPVNLTPEILSSTTLSSEEENIPEIEVTSFSSIYVHDNYEIAKETFLIGSLNKLIEKGIEKGSLKKLIEKGSLKKLIEKGSLKNLKGSLKKLLPKGNFFESTIKEFERHEEHIIHIIHIINYITDNIERIKEEGKKRGYL